MRRITALPLVLLALTTGLASSQDVDPCKRQPFRGRCPGTGPNGQPQRSQFVLRYYLRNGECVSYPYGHCANDENEPKLLRYKEECEDACIGNREVVEQTQSPNSIQTYATMAPKQTDCQKQRELKGSAQLVKGGFVPECDEKGDFKQLQCESDGATCFCVDKNGIEVVNSRCQPGQPKPDCAKIVSAPAMRSNECIGGVEPGPCQGSIKRWYFDEAALTCKQFDYSGCGGNGNNYPTEVACQLRCAPAAPQDQQLCHNGLPLKNPEGGLADCSKTSCPTGFKCNVQPGQSVCCPDVDGNEAGVLDSGRKADICALPKERGPCDRYELRFYYSKELKECKYFFYGGCEGNSNNFAKVEDCYEACLPEKALKNSGSSTDSSVQDVSTVESIPEQEASQNQITEQSDNETVDEQATTDESLVKINAGEVSTPASAATQAAQLEVQPTTADSADEQNAGDAENPEDHTEGQAESAKEAEASETAGPVDEQAQTAQAEGIATSSQTPVQSKSVEVGPSTQSQKQSPEVSGQKSQVQPESQPVPSGQRPVPTPVHTPPPTTTTSAPLPTNRCQHPRDSGHCNGHFDRWYWDSEKRICDRFVYNGCAGNGNNFGSREECLSICHVEAAPADDNVNLDTENVCEHEVDAGNCGGSFPRFAFDRETKDCRSFNYGGCGGNGNNFATMKDCRKKCADQIQATTLPEDVCEHPVDVGECSGVFSRFAFNPATNDCQQFTYGGCGGNGNNFPNKAECLSACAKAPHISQKPHCPALDVHSCTEPCIIFSNRHGCQECVCPKLPERSFGSSIDAETVGFQPQPPAPASGSRSPSPPSPPAPPAPVDIPKKSGHPNVVWGNKNNEVDENDVPEEIHPPVFPQSRFEPVPPTPAGRHVATAAPEPFPELGEQCTQRVDPGPCSNFVPRWFFNPAQGICEPFQYGGCAGNRNHFFTERECQIHCQRFVSPRESAARMHFTFAPGVETTTELVAHPEPRPAFQPVQQPPHVPQPSEGAPLSHVAPQAELPTSAQAKQLAAGLAPELSEAARPERKPEHISAPHAPALTTPEPLFTPFATPQPSPASRGWHFVSKAPVQLVVIDAASSDAQPPVLVRQPPPRLLRPLPADAAGQPVPQAPLQEVIAQTGPHHHPVVNAQPTIHEAAYAAESIQPKPFHPDAGLSPDNNPYKMDHQSTPPPNFSVAPLRPSNINAQYIPPQPRQQPPLYPNSNNYHGISVNNQQYIPPQAATVGPHVRPTVDETANGNPWTSPTMAPPVKGENYQKDLAPASVAVKESQFTAIKKEEHPVIAKVTKEVEASVGPTEEPAFTTESPESSTHKLNIKPITDAPRVISEIVEEPEAEKKAAEVAESTPAIEQTTSVSPLQEEQKIATDAPEQEVTISPEDVKAAAVKTQSGIDSEASKALNIDPDTDSKSVNVIKSNQIHTSAFGPKEESKEKVPVTSVDFEEESNANEFLHRETYMVPERKQSLSALHAKSGNEGDLASEQLIATKIDMDQDRDLLESSGQEPTDITQPELAPAGARASIHAGPTFTEKAIPPEKVVPFPNEPVIEPKTTYPAEQLTTPDPSLASLPQIGRIPEGGVDYNGRPKAGGIQTHTSKLDPSKLLSDDHKELDDLKEQVSHFDGIAVCPNSQNALKYADGHLVRCLPGKNQCPDRSVCYFNGLDFFCCPNVDDPYDNHVFGGYDGEEVKHGYKSTPLNIKAIGLRARRHAPLPATSFSIDRSANSLRFDGKPPHQISRAGLADLRVNPCTQEAKKGSCSGQHLRYFYDINADECRLFYFSGCEGNANNFAAQAECEQRCKLGQVIQKASPKENVPAGQCPGGKLPLGENAPVLCGNQTDSIGCPQGFYCRQGPPDVCCPAVESVDLDKVLSPQRQWGDVRRKERVQGASAPLPVHQAAFGVANHVADKDQAAARLPLPEHKSELAEASSTAEPLFPANMCPDGSDALNGAEGRPMVCGAGVAFDGHAMCPRGFYCAMDLERDSRLCCPLEVQASNVPPPPAVAPYLGHRHANPGEAIGRGSLPTDLRRLRKA